MGRAALESKEGSVDCYRLILPQVIIPSREEPDQNECTEQSHTYKILANKTPTPRATKNSVEEVLAGMEPLETCSC